MSAANEVFKLQSPLPRNEILRIFHVFSLISNNNNNDNVCKNFLWKEGIMKGFIELHNALKVCRGRAAAKNDCAEIPQATANTITELRVDLI
jgi:hypothetical protein